MLAAPVQGGRGGLPVPGLAHGDDGFALMVLLLGWELFKGSELSLKKFGWRFLVHSNWDPVNGDFGALPFIFGTFVSSLLALLMALPLSLATAIYLTELAPGWVRQPAISLIEMLAAIPSVVLGLWGMSVLVPWLAGHPVSAAAKVPGLSALFSGPDWRWLLHTFGRRHPRHHDPAHHHLHFARGFPRRARFAAGGGLCPGGDPLGSDAAGGVARFDAGHIWSGHAGSGPGAGGNDGGDDGHRQLFQCRRSPASLFAPGTTLASEIANEFAEATRALHAERAL